MVDKKICTFLGVDDQKSLAASALQNLRNFLKKYVVTLTGSSMELVMVCIAIYYLTDTTSTICQNSSL